VEIISSLNVWFEILEDDSITLLDGVLNTLWERYSGLMRLKVQGKATTTNSDSPSAQVMNRTLTKLLDNGVDSDPSHEDKTFGKILAGRNYCYFLAGNACGRQRFHPLDASLAILVTI
jgi:hypothetical protein